MWFIDISPSGDDVWYNLIHFEQLMSYSAGRCVYLTGKTLEVRELLLLLLSSSLLLLLLYSVQ